MSWFMATLSPEQVAAGELAVCKAEFEEAFGAAKAPREMALFKRERDDDEGVDLFLTPPCGEYAPELLEKWECIPCERPSPAGLHLVVGHNEMGYYMP
jgi:hypothetical protein